MLISIRTTYVPPERGQDIERMISEQVMPRFYDQAKESVNPKKCTCGKFFSLYFRVQPPPVPGRVFDWTFR